MERVRRRLSTLKTFVSRVESGFSERDMTAESGGGRLGRGGDPQEVRMREDEWVSTSTLDTCMKMSQQNPLLCVIKILLIKYFSFLWTLIRGG